MERALFASYWAEQEDRMALLIVLKSSSVCTFDECAKASTHQPLLRHSLEHGDSDCSCGKSVKVVTSFKPSNFTHLIPLGTLA
jgi:hypothetical protein